MTLLKLHKEATDDTINLNPAQIQSKTYDYKTLVQKLDPWQPPLHNRKVFSQRDTQRK